MAWASITYTFSPSTLIKSSEVNQNFLDCIVNADKGMPSGGIILWSGEIANIPTGWFLCDGNNGTPNLVGKFIQGAGSGYAVGSTGGSATMGHTHTMAHTHSYDHYHYDDHVHYGQTGPLNDGQTDSYDETNEQAGANPSHTHPFTTGSKNSAGYGQYTTSLNNTYGYAVQTGGASNGTTSDGSNTENRPPFLTLAYIMKS